MLATKRLYKRYAGEEDALERIYGGGRNFRKDIYTGEEEVLERIIWRGRGFKKIYWR